jgi:hypothetical protein
MDSRDDRTMMYEFLKPFGTDARGLELTRATPIGEQTYAEKLMPRENRGLVSGSRSATVETHFALSCGKFVMTNTAEAVSFTQICAS